MSYTGRERTDAPTGETYSPAITLTTAGREWALTHAPDSIVARVALLGSGSGWPESHVRTAIEASNRKAATA